MHDFSRTPEWSTAIPAIQEAARFTEHVRNAIPPSALDKKDSSPVTIADFGAQAIILQAMMARFPDDICIAEEDSEELRNPDNQAVADQLFEALGTIQPSPDREAILAAIDLGSGQDSKADRVWTLDPIDGTKGFLRNDQYALALALLKGGTPAFGILACPNLPVNFGSVDSDRGALFWATAGEGAWSAPLSDPDQAVPITVSQIDDIRKAAFCESVESGHSSHSHSQEIAKFLGVTADPVRMDSQCKYAAVARGDASVYLRLPTRAGYEEKIWDHAAGALIVQEAGGTVSDIEGQALDFSVGPTLKNNRGIVASHGRFHDQIINAISQVV